MCVCVYLFLGINGPLFQCCYTSSTVSHLQVGDVGPILDMMAVVLENISTSTIVARATVSAVYLTAKMVSSVPNVSYHKKARPLFQISLSYVNCTNFIQPSNPRYTCKFFRHSLMLCFTNYS